MSHHKTDDSQPLDIHRATPAEQEAAYRNVHEFWGRGLPLDEFLQRRHASLHHQRAEWYVGCIDGQVAASLGCWPVTLLRNGGRVPGFQIGAVHTRPEFRGRAFAPQLIREVERQRQARGDELALLYSDIDPAYYARLGYVACPSYEGSVPLPASRDSTWRVREVDPAGESELLLKLADAADRGAVLCIEKRAARWQALLAQWPGDRFVLAETLPENHPVGWLRLRETDQADTVRLMDFALESLATGGEAGPLAAPLPMALAAARARFGWTTLTGWLPTDIEGSVVTWNIPAGKVSPRQREITMIHPLSGVDELLPEEVAAAGRFVEIDHV